MTSQINIQIQPPRVLCRLLSDIHINTTQTLPYRIHLCLQKSALFVTSFPTYTSLLQKHRLMPIIHNIPSINIHTSIRNSIKTKHLPHFTSFLRQAPCGTNLINPWLHRYTASVLKGSRPQHIWLFPILRYDRISGNYHYPFSGVIFPGNFA